MAWYNAGTVTATNNSGVLTGVGTQFLANIRVGDGLTIAGSTSIHEVTNVASTTQLSFTPVYAGTTGSGKAYAAVPVQGYVKDLADQAKQLILTFSTVGSSPSVIALANLVGSADTLPYFTSGTVMATTPLSAAARTLLDDADIPAMRTTLGMKTAALADVVGTVASGAIIETGNNANGTYIKYQDGTMICWRRYTAAISPMGGYSTGITVGTLAALPLPATFVGNWAGTAGGVDSTTAGWASVYPTAQGTFHLYYFSTASSHGSTLLSIIALGRWKT